MIDASSPSILTPKKKVDVYNNSQFQIHSGFILKNTKHVLPIIVDAYATPTIHTLLFASAAISPVTFVP